MTSEPPTNQEIDDLAKERDRLREAGLGFGTPEYHRWLNKVLFGHE